MSYYTAHELTWKGESPTQEEVTSFLAPLMDVTPDEADSAINGESTKWYDADDHVTALSSKYSSVLFAMQQMGEDGNHTMTYYRDGRSLMKHIEPPPFDEEEFQAHAS